MILMNLKTGEIIEIEEFAPLDEFTTFQILPEHDGYEFTGKTPR